MNIQKRTVALFVAIFVAGIIIGGYMAYRVTWHIASEDEMLSLAVNAKFETSALRGLRESDTRDALELLEALLDSKIILLRANDSYSEMTNNAVREAIQTAREYRGRFPRESKFPDNDAAVNKVLSSSEDGAPRQH